MPSPYFTASDVRQLIIMRYKRELYRAGFNKQEAASLIFWRWVWLTRQCRSEHALADVNFELTQMGAI